MFLVIAFGDIGVVVGLWPCHLVWTVYCIVRFVSLLCIIRVERHWEDCAVWFLRTGKKSKKNLNPK